jgi:hypothetical protein
MGEAMHLAKASDQQTRAHAQHRKVAGSGREGQESKADDALADEDAAVVELVGAAYPAVQPEAEAVAPRHPARSRSK